MTAESEAPEAGLLTRALVVIFGGLFGLTLLLAFLSLPVGVYTLLFTTITPGLGANSVASPPIWIGPLPVHVPFALPVGVLFVSMVAVYAILLAVAASRGPSIPAAFSAGLRRGFSALFTNDLVVAVISIGFLAFTATAIDALVQAGGVPIGSLSGSDLAILLSTSTSPLVEEFGFRVCILGLVALILSLGRSRRAMLEAVWRPASAYEGDEIQTSRAFVLWIAMVASAIVFGLAHIQSNSGWDIGKLPEASYGGLVLGYLYLKHGFHVAVITHWGIDYLGTAFAFFGQGAYGIPWTSDNAYVLQQIVNLNLLGGIGFASFLIVAYLGVDRLLKKRADRTLSQV